MWVVVGVEAITALALASAGDLQEPSLSIVSLCLSPPRLPRLSLWLLRVLWLAWLARQQQGRVRTEE